MKVAHTLPDLVQQSRGAPNRRAGFYGIFITVFLHSALTANPGCKPISGAISAQNITHRPAYPASSAEYITLERMTPDPNLIERIFNNQSVGAFLGAFAAFFLVVLNDWRRERRKVRTLKAEFEVCRAHAHSKLETIRASLKLAREHNGVSPAPVMPFNTTIVRQLTAETIDQLSQEQRRAIDGLCYRMEATDGLLEKSYQIAIRLSGLLGQADRMAEAERLIIDFKDAIVNLKVLDFMLTQYINGSYGAVVHSKFDRAEFEED